MSADATRQVPRISTRSRAPERKSLQIQNPHYGAIVIDEEEKMQQRKRLVALTI